MIFKGLELEMNARPPIVVESCMISVMAKGER